MGVLLIDILFMSIRVSLLFHAQRLSLSFWNAIQLTLVGFFFSTFLPGAAGGDLAKLYYATREYEGRRAEVATVLLFDRIIGLSLWC
jgi:glycosyltransferase 2 family protein